MEDSHPAGLLETVIAAAIPEATTVYLFGSVAAGYERRGSDLDLALLIEPPLDAEAKLRICESLAEALGRDVDLIDLARAPTAFQAQVVSGGRIVRDLDRTARERFEMNVYSAYARLNEERREILEQIRSEGRIHG